MSESIVASEPTPAAFSRLLCSPAISVLNTAQLSPSRIPVRASARSSTASRSLCRLCRSRYCGARDWPLSSRLDAIPSRPRHSRVYHPRPEAARGTAQNGQARCFGSSEPAVQPTRECDPFAPNRVIGGRATKNNL